PARPHDDAGSGGTDLVRLAALGPGEIDRAPRLAAPGVAVRAAADPPGGAALPRQAEVEHLVGALDSHRRGATGICAKRLRENGSDKDDGDNGYARRPMLGHQAVPLSLRLPACQPMLGRTTRTIV